MKEVTTYYLEMKSASSMKEKTESKGLQVSECEIKQFQFNRFLYEFVGETLEWKDKLSWTDDQWRSYSEADTLRTWVAYHKGSPAGYFELQKQEGGDVEILYFGLATNFIGQGFGGYFLSQVLKSAWAWEGTRRVWLRTCSLDHPHALQNYKARGLEVYHVETTNR